MVRALFWLVASHPPTVLSHGHCSVCAHALAEGHWEERGRERERDLCLLLRALIPSSWAHLNVFTSQSPHFQIPPHCKEGSNIWSVGRHEHSVQKCSKIILALCNCISFGCSESLCVYKSRFTLLLWDDHSFDIHELFIFIYSRPGAVMSLGRCRGIKLDVVPCPQGAHSLMRIGERPWTSKK